MEKTVLITGASGKIGRHAAKSFAAAGWRIKRFQRGMEMTQAAKGVDVIVNGMNPPNYQNWTQNIPQITRDHIAAAKASGARVILPGNVYNFGADTSGIWGPQTPQVANSRKGALRVEAEAAYRESGVRCLVLRAGNFLDPEGMDDAFSLIHLSRLKKGVMVMPGAPCARQAWCYLPDWAEAAVQLAQTSLDTFADVPFAGHTASAREMKEALEPMTGPLREAQFPWWAIRLSAPVWGLAREMIEMRYLWDLDHSLAPGPLDTLLPGFQHTPLPEVLRRKLQVLSGAKVQVNPNEAVA